MFYIYSSIRDEQLVELGKKISKKTQLKLKKYKSLKN